MTFFRFPHNESGKRAINEALISGDPDKVITSIHKVCTAENFSKIGFRYGMYYCSKAVLDCASEVILVNLLL